MVIRATTLRSFLWFCVVLLTSLSFPLQVYTSSPFPSLLPYILVAAILMFSLLKLKLGMVNRNENLRNGNIVLMIYAYLFLLSLNTSWQAVLGLISPAEVGSIFVVYLLPVVFYFYFRKTASEMEIKSILLGVIVAGIIVAVYFVYDSYLKLALGEVSDFAKKSFEYSLDRANQVAEDTNDARIRSGFRSYGLLETHSVSGGFIVISTFAALALVSINQRLIRFSIMSISGLVLFLTLNFTSIVAFMLIIFLIEFNGIKFVQGRLSGDMAFNFLLITALCIFIFASGYFTAGDEMLESMSLLFSIQKELISGGEGGGVTMGGLVLVYIERYFQHILDFPHAFLIGDGFGSFGMSKGGDIGFIESMARFGLPYFLLVVFGYYRLIKFALRTSFAVQVPYVQTHVVLNSQSILRYLVCFTLLIFIAEGHYTIWVSKAILPLIFFNLALFERYLWTPARLERLPTRNLKEA